MKLRNTLILFGVVLVAFLLVYIFEIRNPGDSADKSKNLGELLLLKVKDINRLELLYADPDYERIVCVKDSGGEWQIEQPLRARADQKIMDRLISGAMGKSVHRTLKDPGALADYGLENPRVTAIFHPGTGASKTLMLGDTVPVGNYVYVKQKSIPDISVVPANIVDELTKFVSDLRDRTVMALASNDVQKLQLKYTSAGANHTSAGTNHTNVVANLVFACEKKGFEWNLVEPIAAKADTSAVEKVISDLNSIKLDRFADDSAGDLSTYGLSPPRIEVTVTLTSGGAKTLLIGVKEDDLAYAKTGSGEQIFLVKADIIDKLPDDPGDLRDRTIIAFDASAVDRLGLKYPGRAVVCEKKSGAGGEFWQITAPIRTDANSAQIDKILRELQDMKAAEFVSDKPLELDVYGLSRPQIQVVISDTESLLVGKKAGELVYVKSASAESVYLVDAGVVDDLSKDTLDLRSRQVMKFEKSDVKRVELKTPDETVVCIKQERDWRIIEPIREKAKNYVMNDILSQLTDLKAVKFVAEKAARPSEYGLDEPVVTATLTFRNDSTKTLLVGKKLPESDSSYARTAADEVVFVIEKEVVDELKKDVDEIRE